MISIFSQLFFVHAKRHRYSLPLKEGGAERRVIFQKSRGVLSRRTPVVLHFLSFPKKKGNEAKERNRRQIEIFLRSGVLGCSALPMLTSPRTRNFLSRSVLPTQGCETHPSTPPPDGPSGPAIGKFQTGGPPCAGLFRSMENQT